MASHPLTPDRPRMKRPLLLALLLTLALQAAASGRTLRVLAIGNSFSEDAVEQYLHELAQENGVELIIGNACRGGQGLESHWKDVTQQNNTFAYRKIANGTKTDTPRQALADILRDEPWDFITLQQVSQDSGLPQTYEPYLTHLISYIRSLATNPKVRLGLHQTWAYAQDSNHGGFANYDRDQAQMYQAITKTVRQAIRQHPELSFVVPSGTAIQNARTSRLGDTLTRDGYHLDLRIGRYIAACTWFEAITGNSPKGNPFRPQGIDPQTAAIAQQAAHQALRHPYRVTQITP